MNAAISCFERMAFIAPFDTRYQKADFSSSTIDVALKSV
jgi:hypothetical protein